MVRSVALILLILGDLNFTGFQYMNAFQKAGYDPAFSFKETSQFIHAADITIANLEGPLTFAEWSKESEKKKWRFRQLPIFAKGIKSVGINVLLLGNNHIADAGRDGIKDSIDVLDQEGIMWVPAPRNGPLVINRDGELIHLWNVDTFSSPGSHPWAISGQEFARLVESRYAGAVTRPDVSIAFVHAHLSDSSKVNELSTLLRDAGIDWVIFGGEHLPLDLLNNGRTGIHYGLGDFIFGCDCSGTTKGKALILKVEPLESTAEELLLDLGSSSNGFITSFHNRDNVTKLLHAARQR